MTFEKKLLTTKEAMSYLGIGNYQNFKKLVDTGQIGFKKLGKKYFTTQELDRWLANPEYHIDYISEAKSTTRTTHLSAKTDKEYSLEKQLASLRLSKQNAIVSKGLQNCKEKREK